VISAESRGWLIVAGLSTVSGVILGTTMCGIGIFLIPVAKAFGCTYGQASRAATAFLVAMTVTMPIVGWLLDRLQERIVMMAGVAVTVLGYYFAAESSTIQSFTMALALSGAGVAASTYVSGTIVISRWIDKHRGLAMGIFNGTAAIASGLFPWLINHTIALIDWRDTMRWISGLILLMSVPILLLIVVPRPIDGASASPAPARIVETRETFRMPSYWLLLLVPALAQLSFTGIYFFLVPYLTSSGLTPDRATLVYSAANMASFPGAILFGLLADRFGAKWPFALSLLTTAIGGALLLAIPGHAGSGFSATIGFIVLWGATSALALQMAALMLVELTGLQHFGVLMGINSFAAYLAASAGPLVTGLMYDASNSYQSAFVMWTVLAAAALLPLLLIRPNGLAHGFRR